jgi:predicted DNA-binding transcriptional regulator AlpA
MVPNLQTPFLSFEKTKEALDCSRSFMYKLIDQGKLKPKYLGKKPYFIISEIMELMEERPREV